MSGTHRTARPERVDPSRAAASSSPPARPWPSSRAARSATSPCSRSRRPAFVRDTLQSVGLAGPEAGAPDATCPLTGEPVAGSEVPDRPALAVKIENAAEARPQASLNEADVVVEEPVEGGYTRFIAVFQCGDSDRVGPVRSGRTTDPDYLRQLGPAVFGYAGGRNVVKLEVPAVGLVDVNYIIAADAYTRDETRAAPHNLYTTTDALWRAAKVEGRSPRPALRLRRRMGGRGRSGSGRSTCRSPACPTCTGTGTARRARGCVRTATSRTCSRATSGSSAANVVIQVVHGDRQRLPRLGRATPRRRSSSPVRARRTSFATAA